MKELKCPHCQHVFSVDEDMFESLANQVRNAAFQEELERRTAENRKLMQAEAAAQYTRQENDFRKQLGERDMRLAETNARMEALSSQIDSAVKKRISGFFRWAEDES